MGPNQKLIVQGAAILVAQLVFRLWLAIPVPIRAVPHFPVPPCVNPVMVPVAVPGGGAVARFGTVVPLPSNL